MESYSHPSNISACEFEELSGSSDWVNSIGIEFGIRWEVGEEALCSRELRGLSGSSDWITLISDESHDRRILLYLYMIANLEAKINKSVGLEGLIFVNDLMRNLNVILAVMIRINLT
jgi:hypothetical protein